MQKYKTSTEEKLSYTNQTSVKKCKHYSDTEAKQNYYRVHGIYDKLNHQKIARCNNTFVAGFSRVLMEILQTTLY